MKSLRRRHAFTLVELLVVVAIMIVLASLVTAVGPAILNRASKVQAMSDVKQIVDGVRAYYTDYTQYPLTSAQQSANADAVFGGSTGEKNSTLFTALRGTDGGSTGVSNPKAIAYLQPRDAKDATTPKSGIAPTGSANAGQWFDPWGTPYVVFLDADYNNQLNVASEYQGNTTALSLDIGAASFGADKTAGNKSKGDKNYLTSGSDDVISWR